MLKLMDRELATALDHDTLKCHVIIDGSLGN